MELDQRTVDQIRSIGGDQLLNRLVELFLEHTPIRLSEIRRGVSAGDWSRTLRAIHSLRSSSVTLGATDVAERAAELERMAAGEQRDALESALPALESETEAALGYMRSLLAR